jgi:hypothetical protein
MGAESASAANDFSDTPPTDIGEWELRNNLYWNAGAAIPSSGSEAINYTSDADRVLANPGLPGQASVLLPRWNPTAGQFLGGSATIREAFERLVTQYGRPSSASAGVDQALAEQSPTVDILGQPRGEAPDIGAFEWTEAFTADFNNDGAVDAEDLVEWRGDFGMNDRSDADGDGDSDGADFLAWQRQLNASASGPFFTSVPETRSWIILAQLAFVLRTLRLLPTP